MTLLAVLILAAGAPQAATVHAPPPPQRGAQAVARATVEILRAETASPAAGPGAMARQVSPQRNGQVLIEFN